tara:strand:+ start:32096 stop:32590 length:495 start_codon:yes stop_codon:yes gene_type:complete
MKLIFTLFILFYTSQLSFAQNEIARERSSLKGILELGIVVNIEQPFGLKHEALNTRAIRKAIEENFSDLPITILPDKILQSSDEFPILHVHINIMRASNQTYPFSIELNFYQPVKLILNRDLQSMASTWNKGQIGVVSENMLHIISEEAVHVSNLFKDEFTEVN